MPTIHVDKVAETSKKIDAFLLQFSRSERVAALELVHHLSAQKLKRYLESK